MSEFAPNSTRAALEVARVALSRMQGVATREPGAPTMTMAVRASEAWKAVEQVLRELTGGSELSGQALLSEARRVDVIDMESTHALVALREWVERTLAPGSAAQMLTLAPTEAEIAVAGNALAAIERASGVTPRAAEPRAPIAAPPRSSFAPPASNASSTASATGAGYASASQSSYAPPQASAPQAAPHKELFSVNVPGGGTVGTVFVPGEPKARSSGLIMGLIALVVIIAGVGGWYLLGNRAGSSSAVEQGIAAYSRGSKEAARLAFVEAVNKNPNDVRALIYLGRISRDLGNYATARKYLEDAIRIEPKNALALREFASALLADQQPELARRFYVRSLEVDPNDRVAQGFLGCSLVRLQRTEEAARWFERAGPGDWTTCSVPGGIAPASKD